MTAMTPKPNPRLYRAVWAAEQAGMTLTLFLTACNLKQIPVTAYVIGKRRLNMVDAREFIAWMCNDSPVVNLF